MPQFRKKPVVVTAFQVTDIDSAREVAQWVNNEGGEAIFNPAVFNNGGGILVNTLEGSMICRTDWWVIKGVAGEFYPVAPDIFEQTYERVTE